MNRKEAEKEYKRLRVKRTELQVKANGQYFGGSKWTEEDQKEWDKNEKEIINIRREFNL